MKTRSAALFLCALLFASRAHACSCAGRDNTCGATKAGGTLFLGEVVARRSVNVPGFLGRPDLTVRSNVFRIRVLEAFAGSPKTGEEVEVRTGNGGGDCGYGFEVGKRYLVDAYDQKPGGDNAARQDVTLITGICSRTRPEAAAEIILRELRTEAARGRQPDLHGSIRSLEGQYRYPGTPLAGVEVSLTAEKDGQVFRTQTDDAGIYTFSVMPPGPYRAEFTLPAGQKLIRYDNKPLRVEIPANDGTGLACHLDAQTGPTGGVRGQVVDESGNRMVGSVTAHRSGVPERENDFGNEWVEKDGRFDLGYLPDGDYQIEFANYITGWRGTALATVRKGEVTKDVVVVAKPFTPGNGAR